MSNIEDIVECLLLYMQRTCPYCAGDFAFSAKTGIKLRFLGKRKEEADVAGDIEFQHFIDEVIARNDIVDVISEYAKLKRVGNRFSALCPLHNDKKSPSLSISPDKQLFHCFGCGAGGTVLNFIMAAEHLEFMDAAKFLADRARIPIPEFKRSGGHKAASPDKKKLLYEINAAAGRYFFSALIGGSGKEAMAYLKEREIKNSTIRMFGLGYAPEGWNNLLNHLKEKGYREEDMFAAGLIKRRDNGSYYDAFYDGRVMFPIIDVRGNIIGFGGRILKDNPNTGKYLNSPETEIFKKKENLFGLNIAKNNNSGRLYLMEGYMDVISLHQAGIHNAVASLGTAFTPEQAKLVKRYGGRAVLCYDADEAGKKATVRAGRILAEEDIKTKVLTVTDGKDPDEFIKAKGPEAFMELVEQAKPFVEYRIDEIKKQYDFEDADDQVDFTEAAAAVLAEMKNPVEAEVYAARIGKSAGVRPESILARVEALRHRQQKIDGRREEAARRRAFEQQTGGRRDLDKMGLYNAEKLLLSLMCDRSTLKKVQASGLGAEDFSEGIRREIAEKLFALADAEKNFDIGAFLGMFDPEKTGVVSEILMSDKNTQNPKEACQLPMAVMMKEKNKRLQSAMLESGNLEELDQILKAGAEHKYRRN